MKTGLLFLLALCCIRASSQELYTYTEPASNMPARSIGLKHAAVFQQEVHSSRTVQRQMLELQFGLSKAWILHAGTSFSNMHGSKMIWEGARLYTKWRFLSNDDVHRHFRMAAFATAAYSRNHLDHNEINLTMGEQSGVQAGLVATQLWNKLALSASGSWNEVLNAERWNKAYPTRYAGRALNYSLSAGYLLLPFQYKDYKQTNVNLYAELLGSRNLGFANETYYVDLAPSVQAIFNSAAKLNAGYRFQLGSNIYRLAKNSWMVSVEFLFLNALQRKR